MKRKVIYIFFIMLFALLVFSVKVEAASNSGAVVRMEVGETFTFKHSTELIESTKPDSNSPVLNIRNSEPIEVGNTSIIGYAFDDGGGSLNHDTIKITAIAEGQTTIRFEWEWTASSLGGIITADGFTIYVQTFTVIVSEPAPPPAPSTPPAADPFLDVLERTDYYEPNDLDATTSDRVERVASKILTQVTDVGIVLTVVLIVILGIKYMIGSVEEKAEFKKDMLPFLVGSGLLFGILTIVKLLMKIGESI